MNPFTLTAAVDRAGQPAVGRAVRRVRRRYGMSRLDLADAVDVRYRTILTLELGLADFSVALLERVCDALCVSSVVLNQQILNALYSAEIGGARRLLAAVKPR